MENLLKHALGINPTKPQATALPDPAMMSLPDQGSEEYLTLSFSHLSGLTGVKLDIQLSDELLDWSESAILVSREDHGTVTDRTYRDALPASAADRRFMQIQVTRR